MTNNTYFISTNPERYGSDCTYAEAEIAAGNLRDALEAKYGDRVRFLIGEGRDDFEDAALREEIIADVNDNWVEYCF